MKRLIILALFAFAAWYGWHHREILDQILHKQPHHEAVVKNGTGETVTRVRLTVGGQTFVREELAKGASATFPFRVNSDSKFDVVWEYATRSNVGHWSGGGVEPGPMVARHIITLKGNGDVIYETQPL